MAYQPIEKKLTRQEYRKVGTILGKIEDLENRTENDELRERLHDAKSAVLSTWYLDERNGKE